MKALTIRESEQADHTALRALYSLAFPDEDLWPLLSTLLSGDADVISLTAWRAAKLAGHVLLTFGHTGDGTRAGALLGPLGVAPDAQRQGIGSALVERALSWLEDRGTAQVFVLGDPGYYARFGFQPERNVRTPYPIPEEWHPAWQSLAMPDHDPLAPEALRLPAPWMDQSLWRPS